MYFSACSLSLVLSPSLSQLPLFIVEVLFKVLEVFKVQRLGQFLTHHRWLLCMCVCVKNLHIVIRIKALSSFQCSFILYNFIHFNSIKPLTIQKDFITFAMNFQRVHVVPFQIPRIIFRIQCKYVVCCLYNF